jgi:hypothetical protein
MKKLALVVAGLALLAVLALTTDSSGAAQDKPKFTIGEVMQKAHKSGLWKKVAEGKGSDAEEKQLVEFYTALPLNKPPKGDEKDWKAKTTKMLDLAKKIEKGDKDAGAALLKEVNCGACHKAFRN